MMTQGNFARERRKQLGLSQEAVAKMAGVSQGTVSKIEKDGIKKPGDVLRVIKALRLTAQQWERCVLPPTGEGQMLASDSQALSQDFLPVPRLNVEGSMGDGSDYPEVDEVIGSLALKRDWLAQAVSSKNHAALCIISGKGESMFPTFSDGDLLLVDTSITSVGVEGVYVLSANNCLYIKRVRRTMAGHLEVSSDNTAIKTVDVLDGRIEVAIHGRVLFAWNGRKL